MAECVASEPRRRSPSTGPGCGPCWPRRRSMGELVLGLPPGPPRVARGRGPRRAAPHRRAGLAPRLRGSRPPGAQPRPAALPRRRPRPLRRQDPRLARHPARGDPGPGPPRPRPPQPLRGPGGPRARPARGRSTGSASTWSCSAAGRPGWRRRSPPARRASRTFVAEAWGPGGQAGTSSRIENYLGFPSGHLGRRADAARRRCRRAASTRSCRASTGRSS